MDHNRHESRKVADVLQCTFKIPDFQRRYRWTPDHIIQLLEDINQFSLESDERSVYYLQPLVVRKGEDSYIVIDGQQRLTTITMIIDELNKRYTQDFQLRPVLSMQDGLHWRYELYCQWCRRCVLELMW